MKHNVRFSQTKILETLVFLSRCKKHIPELYELRIKEV